MVFLSALGAPDAGAQEPNPQAAPQPQAILLTADACQEAAKMGEGMFSGDTGSATQDGEASCGSSLSSPDVWLRFVAPRSATFFASTEGSDFDTVLSIHEGCPGTTVNQITCDDDSSGTASRVSFSADSGEAFWLRVSGSDGASGAFTLHVGTGGEIRGRVTNSETGEPIASAIVRIFDWRGRSRSSGSTDSTGNYQVKLSPAPYVAVADEDPFQAELFYEIPCPEGPFDCDLLQGTSISVVSDNVENVDFTLLPGGKVSGFVLEEETGLPIEGVRVAVHTDFGVSRQSVLTDATGLYETDELTVGTYFAVAGSSEHGSELYEELPCPRGCDVTLGTAFDVQHAQTTTGVDFTLPRRGGFRGRVTDSVTGEPLRDFFVEIDNDLGFSEGSTSTDSSGEYAFASLSPGLYFARVSGSAHAAELFQDLPCGGRHGSCNLTDGTPIEVTADQITQGIDFTLDPLGFISGVVTEDVTGEPVTFISLLVFDSQGHPLNNAGTTFSEGIYVIPDLLPGSYFVRTSSFPLELIDELYDDIPCEPDCDVTTGVAIEVGLGESVRDIDFVLDDPSRLHADDFETGDLSGWSKVVEEPSP